MPDYSDYNAVIKLQDEAQAAAKSMREQAREQREFLHLRDGQWEPEVWTRMRDHPRYTIDKSTPLIEETTGRIKKSDFGIKVQPVDGTADEDTAETLAGLIRNSSNLSGADHVYNQALTAVVESGLDGWEVVQGFADQGAFHQDLLIKSVNNFIDRVWFDHNSLSRTPEDARHAFKLTAFSLDAFKEKWPDGAAQSLSQDRTFNTLWTATDIVVVGQVYYLVETKRDIILMSDGKVYEDNEDFRKIQDELALEGIVEQDRRESKVKTQWIRQYDGGGWLKEAEKTAFEYISLIPEYGKFAVIDNVITHRGMTLKLMDPQRIYNYARSRQIEEGALSPRDKMMATLEQIEGHTTEWETMNTNTDPVLPYNHVDGMPPPFKIGGSQVNPGLEATSMSMTQDMREVANKFGAAMGDAANARSGVVIDELKESSDTGDIDWTEGHEIALTYTYKVWLSAAKKVYSGTRTSRILGENGEFSMEELNTTRLDQQTGQMITINNLSAGLYDVVCSAGKSYKTRQGETISGILEIGAVDPNVIMDGEDILVNASDGPGMKEIAERIRARKMMEGSIPQSQWTEEEQQQAMQAQQQAQNQPPQPDPMMIAAEAEMQKAQAEMANAQNKQMEIQGNQQISMAQIQLDTQKIELDTQKFLKGQDDKLNVAAAQIDQGQQKLDLQAEKQQFDQMQAMMKAQAAEMAAQQQQINDAVKNIQLLGDMDQFDYDPETQELIQRG